MGRIEERGRNEGGHPIETFQKKAKGKKHIDIIARLYTLWIENVRGRH